MALNLSTLTNPATSGGILAEALTTADFLDPVPILKNLSRGSNKGGDAKQTTALNQPKALPLDANGKGYLYLSGIAGNAPAVTFPTIGASDDFVLEMDVYLVSGTNLHFVSGANGDHRLAIYNGSFYIGGFNVSLSSPLALGVSNIKIERTSGTITLKQNDAVIASRASNSALTFTHLSFNGQFGTSIQPLNGYIQTATLSIGGTEQLNIDFTATNVRHGDTKFQASVGGPVTINQSGNDPATVIKKPVLRFDGANSFMRGMFNQAHTGGYMFAAFKYHGNASGAARIFGVNAENGLDYSGGGFIYALKNASSASPTDLSSFVGTYYLNHAGTLSPSAGDILHEVRITQGEQSSLVNNANLSELAEAAASLNAGEFNIASTESGSANTAIDLEYLALFPASITDEQADAVRNYINTRNNVFDLKDGFGYYFYDAQKAPVGAITTGSASWNGRIVGSDNGDSDRYLTQGTTNDAPVGDGYVVTFADNTDHLEIPQVTQAGWQVVGTSLGTFAYRVDNDAVTELNLLGNASTVTSYRQAGDLYGIILLPETATNKDINEARQLLIDRGASDSVSVSSLNLFWYERDDIVEFNSVDTSSVVDFQQAWRNTPIISFPLIDTSSGTNFLNTWLGCSSLQSFSALDMSSGTNFSGAWQSCSALTSFPSGAKLGTEASNVNFTSAWRGSGLTSFPALDLSKGLDITYTWNGCNALTDFGAIDARNATTFGAAWQGCSALTSFAAGAKLGTAANNVNFSFAWNSSGLTAFNTPLPTANSVYYAWQNCTSLTSFSSELPLVTDVRLAWHTCSSLSEFRTTDIKNGTNFSSAWQNCSALTSFPSGAKLGTEATNVNFQDAWRSTGLTSFSTPLPTATNLRSAFEDAVSLVSFNSQLPLATNALFAWDNCSSLTSFDVSLPSLTAMYRAWAGCSSLTDFSVNVFSNWNPQSISSGVFDFTWQGCTSLTAQSVENILTSIDASGKYATTTGASGGSALTDAGIDIDYNVATGSLSAATNTAVTSLKAKGWSIIVNNVTL